MAEHHATHHVGHHPADSGHIKRDRARLLEDPVPKTLIGLAAPMVLGIAAIILFNVVDTFWVGQLGSTELAAMSFTFPVTFVVLSVAMGIGIGTTSVIARAIGQGEEEEVKRLTTHGLMLANLVVVVFALAGITTIDPVFRLIGADESLVPLIHEYMFPWYLGVGFLVIPMVGNSAIRATGDTKTPSLIMVIAGGVNMVLDPMLIFGVGPFPRLELEGAALATVISWMVTFVAASWLLVKREKMIAFVRPRLDAVLDSWRRILHVGLPAAATNLLVPLSTGVLTAFVARHGNDAVAAFGVGNRLDSLALVGISGLSTAVTPFVGQNYGAHRLERVRQGMRFGLRACLVWGGAMAALFIALSGPLSTIFNESEEVVNQTVAYLSVVPIGYGMFGIALVVNSAFNAMDMPRRSAALVVIRLFVLAIPFAWLGSTLAGPMGIFVGIAAANLVIGLVAYFMLHRVIDERDRARTR